MYPIEFQRSMPCSGLGLRGLLRPHISHRFTSIRIGSLGDAFRASSDGRVVITIGTVMTRPVAGQPHRFADVVTATSITTPLRCRQTIRIDAARGAHRHVAATRSRRPMTSRTDALTECRYAANRAAALGRGDLSSPRRTAKPAAKCSSR